ncbi:hypothetical protein GRAN_0717 [Granulicella sibirica]|uniref:PIN domain-containing protein n=2 Tax=Granulicella sibirica TaxID=2479048 RepID=A0A4Q0T2H2_9BACT|nr:hypothetical protein GRAN_0717 [Granulicella sibirica]
MLSPLVYEVITRERKRDGLAVSGITLWELAMLLSRGRVQSRTPLSDFLRVVENSFSVLQLTSAVAETSMAFTDAYPKDPMDRMIGATALVHGLQLITRDERIRRSGEVPCVWD